METLSMGEVARHAGLRTSTIRYDEQAGLLPSPRCHGGRRVYDASVLDRLARVRVGQAAGSRLAEIRALLRGSPRRPPAPRWRAHAAHKRAELDGVIARARPMPAVLHRLDGCRCATLDACAAELRRGAAG